MFIRAKKNKENRIYLQVVESYRDNGHPRQRVLWTLGRLDILQQNGQLDGLIKSAIRFSEKLAVIEASKNGGSVQATTVKIGPALVFEKLWKDMGLGKILDSLLRNRRFQFSLERAIFLTVLHRLFCSGSDRAAERWKDFYSIEGVKKLNLHHLYRAMAWLGQELEDQESATPFSPRCTKDLIEEEIFEKRKNLFSSFELVFFDTTSIYFEGEGGESLGKRGHSKDHRPDLKQMVVGAVLDNEGNPICCEMWPGNTTDVKTLLPIVKRLKKRFGIEEVCIVSDRGMISSGTIAGLESEEYKMKYILGVRMRNENEVKKIVLQQGGRFREIYPHRKNSKDPSPLKVKEVKLNKRRYIICLNEEEEKKDIADRTAILESLENKLKQGDKSLVGNKGYRRYIKTAKGHFSIDKDKVEEERRYDGKWILRTNTDFSAEQVALKYKQLWIVEDIFRSMKSILETRPVYHKCDETIRGHVFCSFLALVLRKELQDRLATKGHLNLEWDDIIRDLDNLHEIKEVFLGKKFIIREECRGVSGKVIQAAGVALPPTIRQV